MDIFLNVAITCIIIFTIIMVFHFLFSFPLIIKDFILALFGKDDE